MRIATRHSCLVCVADSRNCRSCRDQAAQQPLDFLPLLPLGFGEVGQRRVAHAGSAEKDAEIAEVMGLTTRAVKSLLSRARENLRAALSGYVSLDGEPLPEAPGMGLQGRRQGRDGRAPRRQADPDRPWSAGNC
jgi:hypothetical protein